MQDNLEQVDHEIDQELHRRALADRVIRRIKAVEDFKAAKKEEEERQRRWEIEHPDIRRLPRRSYNITPGNPVSASSPSTAVRNNGP
jgi:hypothetical protein